MPISIFQITSRGKLKLTLQPKYLSNCNKNTIFVEANAMNSSAKCKVHPPLWLLRSWCFSIFCKFSLLVAMATYQIEKFGLKWYVC